MHNHVAGSKIGISDGDLKVACVDQKKSEAPRRWNILNLALISAVSTSVVIFTVLQAEPGKKRQICFVIVDLVVRKKSQV
jgi:hypothetical protein